MISSEVVVGTLFTPMLNVALVCPIGTATREFMPSAGCVLLTVTSASPVAGNADGGIGALNRTVPVRMSPPVTEVALSVNAVSFGPGVLSASRRDAFWMLTASIVTSNENGTGDVAIGKVADFAPAGTVTLAGTDAYCG